MSIKTFPTCQVAAIIFMLTPATSFAVCKYSSAGKTFVIQFSLPKTLTYPRDLAIGETLAESSVFTQTSSTPYTCSEGSVYGVKNNLGSALGGASTFPIGNTGLSWVVEFKSPTGPAFRVKSYSSYGMVSWNTYNHVNSTYKILIVKTGNISEGATIPAGEIGTEEAQGLTLSSFISSQATHLVASTCATPNVTVKMGQQSLEDLTEGISSSSKTIPFSLKLFNCPEGINSVSYTLTPTSSSPSLSDTKGLISLGKESTAKGVGLQIADSNLTPITLNTKIPFNEYSIKGGNFSIPLAARYTLQHTGTRPTPGSANADITFTMSYE